MLKTAGNRSEFVDATVKLSLYGEPVEIKMSIPTGRVPPSRMLPVFRSVAENIIGSAVTRLEREGASVSCKAGCGACCRQLVPISETEARMLKALVDEMPEPRRGEVKARFESARTNIETAGLIEQLRRDKKPIGSEFRELGMEYFRQGIPCPFLEEESCSIHPDRPIVCREYLVVSPPENCARQNGEPIKSIRMPAEVSKAVSAIGSPPDAPFERWVPLSLALEWAAEHTNEPEPRPGTELVREMFDRLLA
jgi:Fe-S-cluster containining protein